MLFSHHTIATMDNPIRADDDPRERVLGDAVLELLLRYPNVVLWVNGHTHVNSVTAHARPAGAAAPGGFWEVNTASHIDFPQQARIVELADNHDGTISIFGTIVDSAAPLAVPGALDTPQALAALSRELAANDWQERPAAPGAAGQPDGRAARSRTATSSCSCARRSRFRRRSPRRSSEEAEAASAGAGGGATRAVGASPSFTRLVCGDEASVRHSGRTRGIAAGGRSTCGAPVLLGEGNEPGVTVDAAGTAYVAWVGNGADPTSLNFCRLPRGATACDVNQQLTVPGTSLSRPFVVVSGARVDVISATATASRAALLHRLDATVHRRRRDVRRGQGGRNGRVLRRDPRSRRRRLADREQQL